MKVSIISDIHLKNYSDSKFIDGIPLKLYEILDAFEQCCKYSIESGISKVFILGDVGDTYDMISAKSFILFKEKIEKYGDLEFHILHGNHDISDREISSINIFEGLPNVKVYVNEAKVLEFGSRKIGIVPYGAESQIKDLPDCDVLFGHFSVEGVVLSSGYTDPNPNVKMKDLDKFKVVVSGHVHKPQVIGKVWYVGSPIQLNRGEAGEEKRFLVLDLDTLSIESIPIQGYRKYILFEITKPEDVERMKEEVEKYKDDNVVIRLKKKIENIDEILGDSNCQVVADYEEEIMTRNVITLDMSFEEQVKKYLEIKVGDQSKIPAYLEVFKEIMNL